MNVSLIYNNNTFNFDLRKDISIKYLEDLASKLINKDKSSFELLYKDYNLSEYANCPLKDYIKEDINASIIISPKKTKQKLNIKKVLPKIKLIKSLNINNIEKNHKEKQYNLNVTETSQLFNDYSIEKKRKKENKFITENKFFEEIYDNKENELFSLMKNMSQKIKEYDNILYKKYKNNSQNDNKDNKDLLLFEKNVINFKCKQISHIKRLIKYFNKGENDISEGTIILDDFYKEIKNYDNEDIYLFNNKKKIYKNLLFSSNKNENKNIFKELPLLNNNENINKNNNNENNNVENNNINNKGNNNIKSMKELILSQRKIENIININKTENKEKKDKLYLSENKPSKKAILSRNIDNIENELSQNINSQEKIIYNTIDNEKIKSKKSLGKNSIENNESLSFSKLQEKNNNILQNLLSKKENNIIITNNNINTNKINNNRNVINNKNKTKLHRRDSVENIEYNQNKLSVLYELSEHQKKRYNEDDSNIDENYILENKNKDFNELSDDDDDDEEKKNYSYEIKNLKISLGPRKKKSYRILVILKMKK